MNLKSLSRPARRLIDAILETDADETYDLIEAEEDGDTIILTFSKITGAQTDHEEVDEDDG